MFDGLLKYRGCGGRTVVYGMVTVWPLYTEMNCDYHRAHQIF